MINNIDYGYVRAGVGVPKLKVADPNYNSEQIYELILSAVSKDSVKILAFPELSITGYTCADLFYQRNLLVGAEKALEKLIEKTREYDILVAVGMPIKADNQLFNCAVLFHMGRILGAIPKTFVPSHGEFSEGRWFSSSTRKISDFIDLCGQKVPFNENLLLQDKVSELCIGVEIGEDLWMPVPPSSLHAQYGANLIINLSANNEAVGRTEYRKALVSQQSARCMAGYLYASAGQTESTTDVVFGGHSLIAENGSILEETRFEDSLYIYHDIDIEKLMNDRRKSNCFIDGRNNKTYEVVMFSIGDYLTKTLKREVNPRPFIPGSRIEWADRCKEICMMQSTGLAQRLAKTGIKKSVIGISGGLDSTLALLVCVKAYEELGYPMSDIIGITMPGFGTTGRTYNNAMLLMKYLGITIKEISIKEACVQHYKDIGHDINVHDVTYENVQARERTQILMDVANKEGGLVIGTGDLSELALGWCTYNGDHMSMYAVNSSIPKTLVRHLVRWFAEKTDNEEASAVLTDILNTPVSPELLPPDESGKILQVTEDIVGSYELHDFFLYNMLRNGYTPKKIFMLANIAFKDVYDSKTTLHWLKVFYKRFFTQQFKRSCLPDGVKVGSVCLSPRGDWRMPSDASYQLWASELENL